MITNYELDMIQWRAGRGCHFDVTFLPESTWARQVIEDDVPLLVSEIRRLKKKLEMEDRAVCTCKKPMLDPRMFVGERFCLVCGRPMR